MLMENLVIRLKVLMVQKDWIFLSIFIKPNYLTLTVKIYINWVYLELVLEALADWVRKRLLVLQITGIILEVLEEAAEEAAEDMEVKVVMVEMGPLG